MEEWLSESLMQKIASENNLAETAFVVKKGEGFQIRWFTPECEIDLCGHATLASAYILNRFVEPKLQNICFNSKSGILTVTVKEDVLTMDFPSRMPNKLEQYEDIEALLGVKIKEAYLLRDLMVVVENEEVVRNFVPEFEKIKKIQKGDGVIITAKGDECDFVSRFFYPTGGINEDPVTGSAHCNLIPYWAEKLGKTKMNAKQLSKRGGKLYCEFEGERVKISGRASLYMVGEIFI